ncbi:MAG TPA: hypothetical protein VFC44_24365 [Candidatus Saccharimonadales bacterium]|nr:hypothetical protein [Candidatus Saccharimonadales bacterium]
MLALDPAIRRDPRQEQRNQRDTAGGAVSIASGARWAKLWETQISLPFGAPSPKEDQPMFSPINFSAEFQSRFRLALIVGDSTLTFNQDSKMKDEKYE